MKTKFITAALIGLAWCVMGATGSNFVNGIVVANDGVQLPALGASKLLRTDSSKNAAEVTIGSGITFDGTTISAAAASSLLTNITVYNSNDIVPLTIRTIDTVLTTNAFEIRSNGSGTLVFTVTKDGDTMIGSGKISSAVASLVTTNRLSVGAATANHTNAFTVSTLGLTNAFGVYTNGDTYVNGNLFVKGTAYQGYTMTMVGGWESFAPADATTYYIGGDFLNSTMAGATTYGNIKVMVPRTGTVKTMYLKVRVQGVLGTTELVTNALRLNDTTDFAGTNFTYSAAVQDAIVTSANQAVVQGDYIALKVATPTWVTNPTGIKWYCVVYIE